MKEYELLAKSYEKLLETTEEIADREAIKKNIESLRIVSGKNEEQINSIFNTGAFNEICKGYFRVALQNCDIPEEKQKQIMEEIRWLFDTMDASDARKKV